VHRRAWESPAGRRMVPMPFYVNSMNVGGLGVVWRVPRVGLPTNGIPIAAPGRTIVRQISPTCAYTWRFTSRFCSKSLIIWVNKLCCNRDAKSLFRQWKPVDLALDRRV
jgi:hypothetical protein